MPFQAGSPQSLPKAPGTGLQVFLQAWPLQETLHSDIPGSLRSPAVIVTAFTIRGCYKSSDCTEIPVWDLAMHRQTLSP